MFVRACRWIIGAIPQTGQPSAGTSALTAPVAAVSAGGQPSSETSDVGGSSGRFHQREAESSRVFAQGRDVPFADLVFICRGAEIPEGGAMREQVIDDAGKLVGGGHKRRVSPMYSSQ